MYPMHRVSARPSTLGLGIVVALTLLTLNVVARPTYRLSSFTAALLWGESSIGATGLSFNQVAEHGWPLTFMRREWKHDLLESPTHRAQLLFLGNPDASDTDAALLLGDVTVAAFVVLITSLLWERRCRKRLRLLQVTVADLLVVAAVGALIFAGVAAAIAEQRRLQRLQSALSSNGAEVVTNNSPIARWLPIFGEHDANPWSRFVSVTVSGDNADVKAVLSILHEHAFSGSLSLENIALKEGQRLHLDRLTHLRHLRIRNVNLADTDLNSIASLHQLRSLDLCGVGATNDHLSKWAVLIHLEGLCLEDLHISDSSMPVIASFEQLRILMLPGTDVTDDGLRHLERLYNLRTLVLSGCHIKGTGLDRLSRMSKLCELRLDRTPVRFPHLSRFLQSRNDATLHLIIAGTALQELEVQALSEVCSVSDGGMPSKQDMLDRLKQVLAMVDEGTTDSLSVESLSLFPPGKFNLDPRYAFRFGDSDVQHVLGVNSLLALDLRGTNITDEGLRELVRAPQLTSLSLGDTHITDDGLASLAELANLTIVDLSDTAVSDDGIRRLSQLRSLRLLDLRGTYVTDRGIAAAGLRDDIEVWVE